MRRRAQAWITVPFFMALVGCALFQTASPPIYQDASLTVWLESNPAGTTGPITETDAQYVTAEQLAFILKGLKARQRTGLLQSLLTPSQAVPVFLDDELPRVGKALRIGLRVTSPLERVAFQLSRTGGMEGREETSGAVYLRGSLLYVTLTKFRSRDRVRYDSLEEGFDLTYEPTEAVVQREGGFARRWLGGEPSLIIVNVQRFKEPSVADAQEADTGGRIESPARPAGKTFDSAGQPSPAATQTPAPAPRAAPAPSPDRVESLQHQIKELTDSNQELRTKLLELQNRQDQSEELNRLRQELAETKQALADKVLELNRLKSKARGSPKEKSPPPSR